MRSILLLVAFLACGIVFDAQASNDDINVRCELIMKVASSAQRDKIVRTQFKRSLSRKLGDHVRAKEYEARLQRLCVYQRASND